MRRGNNQWPRRLENKLLVLQGSTYAQLLYMYMFANNPHQLSPFYINSHFRHRLVQFTHYICKHIHLLYSLNIHGSAERSRFEIPLISWPLDTSRCKNLLLFSLKHIHSVHRTDVNFTATITQSLSPTQPNPHLLPLRSPQSTSRHPGSLGQAAS